MSAAAVRALAIALAVGAAAAVFAETRHYGLLGWDSYPLILTSRVVGAADLPSLLSEPLMEGRYPGAFYR